MPVLVPTAGIVVVKRGVSWHHFLGFQRATRHAENNQIESAVLKSCLGPKYDISMQISLGEIPGVPNISSWFSYRGSSISIVGH